MNPSNRTDDFEVLGRGQELVKLLEDVFTDEFMRENTRFQSFEGFRYSSAVIVNWNADILMYSRTLLDSFVNESTDFSCWDEMVRAATARRYHGGKTGSVQEG